MAAKRKKGADESLTTALARLLEKTILPDLTARAKTPAVAALLAEQHARERAESRTADALAEWIPRWLEQIGAAWVLSCVFLRTLEDRGLVRHRRIAGEGAADAEHLFFEIAPSLLRARLPAHRLPRGRPAPRRRGPARPCPEPGVSPVPLQ
jgi:hypothetical protein